MFIDNMTVPQVTFRTRVRDPQIEGENPFKWKDVSSKEIFENRNIVVFALPGAFTPTCSSTHLPGYEENYDKFTAYDVDQIYCLSVNDAFSMFQWGKKLKVQKVQLLPDGNGDFTRLMGMLVSKNNLGFGMRSWRYSMHVKDGIIQQLFSEPGKADDHPEDPFVCSDANTMLEYLKDLRLFPNETNLTPSVPQ